MVRRKHSIEGNYKSLIFQMKGNILKVNYVKNSPSLKTIQRWKMQFETASKEELRDRRIT